MKYYMKRIVLFDFRNVDLDIMFGRWNIQNGNSLTMCYYNFPPSVTVTGLLNKRAVLTQRFRLTAMEIPIIKIRLSGHRVIFIMTISKPGKTVFILTRGTGRENFTMTP